MARHPVGEGSDKLQQKMRGRELQDLHCKPYAKLRESALARGTSVVEARPFTLDAFCGDVSQVMSQGCFPECVAEGFPL